MGNMLTCFKKQDNLNTKLLTTGRYCYYCDHLFDTKIEYTRHALDCKRGDL